MNVLKIQNHPSIPSYNNAFGAVPIMPASSERVSQILNWNVSRGADTTARISLLVSQAMIEKKTPVDGRFPTMH